MWGGDKLVEFMLVFFKPTDYQNNIGTNIALVICRKTALQMQCVTRLASMFRLHGL